MKNLREFNMVKRLQLMNKIHNCGGDYNLYCIDVDDVLFNTDPYVQKILEKIDYRATQKYKEEISHESSEDSKQLMQESWDILDAILEEREYKDYNEETGEYTIKKFDKIDYEDVYQDKNLFPGAVEFIRNLLKNRKPNDFYIFLSHRNPEREAMIKLRKLYELFPEIDGVETLSYHIEPGSDTINSKALWIKQIYGLESLDRCYLIDNSKSNDLDFRKHGGKAIRLLPKGFNEKHTLADHMSKITTLDPVMINLAMVYIDYARKNPDFVKEKDISMDEVRRKK